MVRLSPLAAPARRAVPATSTLLTVFVLVSTVAPPRSRELLTRLFHWYPALPSRQNQAASTRHRRFRTPTISAWISSDLSLTVSCLTLATSDDLPGTYGRTWMHRPPTRLRRLPRAPRAPLDAGWRPAARRSRRRSTPLTRRSTPASIHICPKTRRPA